MLNNFSLVFLVALGLMITLRLWLGARQVAHIRAHRAAVPAQFADRIVGIAQGKVVFDGAPADLTQPVLDRIYRSHHAAATV